MRTTMVAGIGIGSGIGLAGDRAGAAAERRAPHGAGIAWAFALASLGWGAAWLLL